MVSENCYTNGVKIIDSVRCIRYISRMNAFDGKPENVKFNNEIDIASANIWERRRNIDRTLKLKSMIFTFDSFKGLKLI